MTAALYRCEVGHARRAPIRNVFGYRTYLWLVDLADLPRLSWPLRLLAGFRAGDHVGGGDRPDSTIRANLDRYLATEDVDLAGGRVLMLTAARVLGHVFNPLTVYWCHGPDGRLECVVAEVHNTYGERHCYLLRPGPDGAAETAKAFYVSPFEPVEGRYRMRLPVPGDELRLAITLHRPGGKPFTATVRGSRRPATPRTLVALALRHPLAPLAVALRIRRQGIGLWLRGLPVVPRPDHRPQEAVR